MMKTVLCHSVHKWRVLAIESRSHNYTDSGHVCTDFMYIQSQ